MNTNKSNSSYTARTTSMGSAFLAPIGKHVTQMNWTGKTGALVNQNSLKGPTMSSGSTSVGMLGNAPPYKKLTAAKLKARREKGLCYYCDEKYNPSHRCKSTYLLLVGQEEIDELLKDDELEDSVEPEENGNEINIMEVDAGISMNALAGQFHPSTLCVTGHCAGKKVKILIDNGSNNNFIKASVATRLKLPHIAISGFKVGTRSGVSLQCERKCADVKLKIQGHVFMTDLFVLEIKGADVVLGVQWLIELGIVMTNYKDLTMQFQYSGKEVKLQGENILATTPLKNKSLTKMLNANSISNFF